MPDLLEKITQNAEARLTLPDGHTPAQELKRYKAFLKVEGARLKMLHRAGGSGRHICQARSAVLDALHRHILYSIQAEFEASNRAKVPRYALVAIGGYGRGELNPCSDIDIMLLHAGDNVAAARGKLNPFLTKLTEPGGLLYTLFDIGLKVGYSVRTINDCIQVANEDMQSKTSLIEARLITGDESLFQQMQALVLAKCVIGYVDQYIAARIEDQETRRAKYANTVFLQEPNIKNGCGGLRDFQNLIWMAHFKHRTRDLNELEEKELISGRERKDLEAAYDFLLRARNELHYLTNRDGDVLTKSVQPSVAHYLGYPDRSPSKRLERFMRDYYLHARDIYQITRMLEQRLALNPTGSKLRFFTGLLGRLKQTPEVDGFEMGNGEIKHLSPRIFHNSPRRLMRVFLHVQQRGLRLHPDTAQLIRQNLRLVDSSFQRDPKVHETFREILSQPGNVGATLRAMHEVDFLGKYLPEFGRLTCLVQHEFYHQYTADEHTLRCIEKLDSIWTDSNETTRSYHEIFTKLDRPFPLYMALILHDAGRGLAKNHSEGGVKLASRIARRHRLDKETTRDLEFLIKHHLTMVLISQRRDLEDPSVISQLAKTVETPERLRALTLHTVADSLGTSDDLWNGFKDTLHKTLYRKTLVEVGGETTFLRSEKHHRENVREQVGAILPETFSPEEIDAHFTTLPDRYFHINSAKEIAADGQLVHRFMWNQLGAQDDLALAPVIMWRDEPNRGCTSVRICTWDRLGVFSKIAGSFAGAGLSILAARGFTRDDEIVLDTFEVVSAFTGALVDKNQRAKCEEILYRALTDEVDFDTLISKLKEATPVYQAFAEERMPTTIHFDNETSSEFTVIDLETEDRIGLLYAVSQAFAASEIDIDLAKISTEKGAAIDSFYVSQKSGGKLDTKERHMAVEAILRTAILNLEELRRQAH